MLQVRITPDEANEARVAMGMAMLDLAAERRASPLVTAEEKEALHTMEKRLLAGFSEGRPDIVYPAAADAACTSEAVRRVISGHPTAMPSDLWDAPMAWADVEQLLQAGMSDEGVSIVEE